MTPDTMSTDAPVDQLKNALYEQEVAVLAVKDHAVTCECTIADLAGMCSEQQTNVQSLVLAAMTTSLRVAMCARVVLKEQTSE